MSSVDTSLLLHSHSRPTRPSLHLKRRVKGRQANGVSLDNQKGNYDKKKEVLEGFVPASSALVRPVPVAADLAVVDGFTVAVALADEVEDNLHLLCESQGLYLDNLRIGFVWTTFRGDADVKMDLKEHRRNAYSLKSCWCH